MRPQRFMTAACQASAWILFVGIARAATSGHKCSSWCHWDWKHNCASSACSQCDECIQQGAGRPACHPTDSHDLVYEECSPICQRAICYMCMCRACSGCGGSPPETLTLDGCQTNVAVSLDVMGQMELTFAEWRHDEVVTMHLPPGMSVKATSSEGFGDEEQLTSSQQDGHLLTIQISGSRKDGHNQPAKMLYDYEGIASTFMPQNIACHAKSPSPPPLARVLCKTVCNKCIRGCMFKYDCN